MKGRSRGVFTDTNKQNTTLDAHKKVLVGTLSRARTALIRTMFHLLPPAVVRAVARSPAHAH